jgi:hypothetical protein
LSRATRLLVEAGYLRTVRVSCWAFVVQSGMLRPVIAFGVKDVLDVTHLCSKVVMKFLVRLLDQLKVLSKFMWVLMGSGYVGAPKSSLQIEASALC